MNMMEEPHPQVPVSTNNGVRNDLTTHAVVSFRQRRTILTTLGVFLLCFTIECLLDLHVIISLVNIPFVLLLLFLDLVLAFSLGWFTAEPLAIFAYLREVQNEQKRNSKLYMPLSALKNIYETPINYQHNDDDSHNQKQDVRELVRRLKTHLLILGLPGAGKTITLRACQYAALEQYWQLLWKKNRIPVYIPMKDYNVFLGQDPPTKSVFAYLLHGSELTGMRHLKPYLERLAKQGRLLLLCDGLNEVDGHHLGFVCAELMQTMQASQNLMVMTCRELDYREQPTLQQLVGKGYAAEALILPLKLEQIYTFVEQYLKYADDPGTQRHRYSAHEINQHIEHSRLSYNCTNPMMLVTLIKTIDEVGIDRDIQIGTRGRLLSKFVTQLVLRELKQSDWRTLNEQDIVLFLSKVACIARLKGLRNAIQLGQTGMASEGATPRTIPLGEFADRLQVWLDQHTMQESVATHQYAPRPYTRSEIEQFLAFAQSAALISLSTNGVLSFRHELIAEYFAAAYLAYLYQMAPSPQASVPFANELVADIGSWSEPVAIWAGMSDDPIELARRLANLGQSDIGRAYNALTLSLACIGVVWNPPQPQQAPQRVQLPDNVSLLLVSFVSDAEKRVKLAATLKRSADEGGIEVYRSLLPLIMDAHIDDLLLLLDQQAIPDLLFDYLRDAVETGMPTNYIKRLVYILGRFGAVVIPRAVELSQPAPRTIVHLRVEAINVLGSTRTTQAVEPLIAYLGADEGDIVQATVGALVHLLGPTLALEPVLEELKSHALGERVGKVHWSALAVLRGFLSQNQHDPRQYPLTTTQYQRIIEALLRALSSKYLPPVQQEAKRILLQVVDPTTNTQDQRWKRVVELLIRSLSDRDAMKVPHLIELLKQVGKAATPLLLTELQTNQLESVRVRIVEILGAVRDVNALQPLLPLLADPFPTVQQQVATALYDYAPQSIPYLIQMVVSDQSEDVARKAVAILEKIGEPGVDPMIQALVPIVHGRTQLLIEALVHLHATKAVPPLIWLLKTPESKPDIAISIIRALGHFPEKVVVVVPPLIEVLTTWVFSYSEEASRVLSSFGELALEGLLVALDVEQDTVTTQRVRRTLLNMNPFPNEHLLAAFNACSDAQAQQLMRVFLQKGDTAPFLVRKLTHDESRIREYVLKILNQVEREKITPPLLEALNNPKAYDVIAGLLLKYRENIPELVKLLSDPDRSDPAGRILLDFGIVVLRSLVEGLNDQNPRARRRSQDILITLVQQEPEIAAQQSILEQVVGLFAFTSPSSYAWDSLLHVLTNQFAGTSLPVLLQGLEDAKLRDGCAKALVGLVRNNDAQAKDQLLAALRVKERRNGAASALVELDAEVVDPVGKLVVDDDAAVALIAQNILSNIGAAALPFVWARYRDTDARLREAARRVFRNMPTEGMKDTLVEQLTSEDRYDVEMALTLLLERIFDEDTNTTTPQKMIPALLEHVQVHSRESSNLRVIALLLLQRKEIVIKHLIPVLYNNHQEWLTQVFLLLNIEGGAAKESLTRILNNPAPAQLHREVAGVMGLMGLEAEVGGYAIALSKHDLSPNQAQTIDQLELQLRREQLEISLRALGGLLAGGQWDTRRLEDLLFRTADGTAEHDLYSVLLGKQFSGQIEKLEKQIRDEQNQRKWETQDLKRTIGKRDDQVNRQQEQINELLRKNRAQELEIQGLKQQAQSPPTQGI